jgi:GT2 family glycosyltransferase
MITCVIALNRADILARTLPQLLSVTSSPVIVLDNGSQPPLEFEGVAVHRAQENAGNYKSFEVGLGIAGIWGAEVIGFMHSDVFVYDDGWDKRVQSLFDADPKLGLVGFVASNEIESHGGRGMGTVLNFQGRQECGGGCSVHGRCSAGFEPAAQVDGCVMIFRRAALAQVGFKDFAPHHFYDRLMSCQMLEAGWRVGYVGVACDHLGGRTTMFEQAYHDVARRWCEERGISRADGNWDYALYREAEKRFLDEYSVRKRFIPLKVSKNWEVHKR